MSGATKVMRRPSHETIVDLIEHAKPEELELVAWFIKMTKIPKGVAKVTAAWEKKHKEMQFNFLRDRAKQELMLNPNYFNAFVASLLQQIRAAACSIEDMEEAFKKEKECPVEWALTASRRKI